MGALKNNAKSELFVANIACRGEVGVVRLRYSNVISMRVPAIAALSVVIVPSREKKSKVINVSGP